MKVAVLGSGGWGTALAMLLVENGHDVTLWSYQAEESRHLAETGRWWSWPRLPSACGRPPGR